MRESAQDRHDRHKKLVNKAIDKYQVSSGNCVVSGVDIMRYSKVGLIEIKSSSREQFACDAMEFYPVTIAYVILQYAKEGKVQYKEQSQ